MGHGGYTDTTVGAHLWWDPCSFRDRPCDPWLFSMPSATSVSSVLTRVPVNETGRGTEKRGRKGEFDRAFAKQAPDAMAK